MGSNPIGPASRNHYSGIRPTAGKGNATETLARATDSATGINETKRARYLADENVSRWYENLAAGSRHTADVALRRLSRFCELAMIDHNQLVKLEQKQLEDLVQDKVRELESMDYAPDYVAGILKGVRSWLKHNGRELKRDVKIRDQGVPKTLEGEKVPEPAQLQEVLSVAPMRGKVSVSLMAFSGVRPEVLGNKDGSAGLVLKDLPDLDLEKLEFGNLPAQVVVRRELSKVKHQYFSYLNEKGCAYLLAYLGARSKSGEELRPESPVIKADENHKAAMEKHYGRGKGTPFICTANITSEVKRAINRAGYPWRPYVLRSYFDSHLLTAELQGRISPTARAFFMGHKGDIERKYTLNKLRLPRELAEQMKEQYVKGSAFLVAEQLTQEQVDKRIQELKVDAEKKVGSELEELRAQVAALARAIGPLLRQPVDGLLKDALARQRVRDELPEVQELKRQGLLVEV